MYRYGANIGFYALSYAMTMVVTSEIFLPVFYRLGISSTYEVSMIRFLDECGEGYCTVILLFCKKNVMDWFDVMVPVPIVTCNIVCLSSTWSCVSVEPPACWALSSSLCRQWVRSQSTRNDGALTFVVQTTNLKGLCLFLRVCGRFSTPASSFMPQHLRYTKVCCSRRSA